MGIVGGLAHRAVLVLVILATGLTFPADHAAAHNDHAHRIDYQVSSLQVCGQDMWLFMLDDVTWDTAPAVVHSRWYTEFGDVVSEDIPLGAILYGSGYYTTGSHPYGRVASAWVNMPDDWHGALWLVSEPPACEAIMRAGPG